jgi:Holliday junction resolvasome RuvABC endonuclease subunit
MTVYIGLDLSLTSPAVAIYDKMTDTWLLYAFAQRVREDGFVRHHKNVTITLLPAIPCTVRNEERYEHIRRHLVDSVLGTYQDVPEVRVGIEHYAFGATHTGNSYKLSELGGVIKHSIYMRYPRWTITTVPPTQWKKYIVGNGRASKSDVVDFVQQALGLPPLLSLLGLTLSASGAVPCPAQDLADAVCINLYGRSVCPES